MTTISLFEGDNRETLQRLIDQGVRVHSCVCDPPYGLTSVVKRFGKEGAAPANVEGTDGSFNRMGGGFMGQQWDASGIERDPDFWRLVWEILLPGGYCLAFSGARTGHWQAVAMEQAGFIMHPMTGWCFGSGFPKALDASKAIDRHLGAERKVVGTRDPRSLYDGRERSSEAINTNWRGAEGRTDTRNLAAQVLSESATPEAATWEGWKLGAAAMKPALEPIYVGQKPFSEKTGAANLLKHGVGALNIDGCRVECESGGRPLREVAPMRDDVDYGGNALCGRVDGSLQSSKAVGSTELGRYPANLIHDGSPEVRALFGESQGQIARTSSSSSSRKNQSCYGEMRRGAPGSEMDPREETDTSAARFFNAFAVEPEALYYHAKASTRDRVFQCQSCGMHGVGAKPSCSCPDRKLRGHPTVKPIGLMRHLVRLVTPPGGTVLDPFAGTGTTGAAAQAEGFDCILMEAQPEYAADIRARLGLPAPVTTLDPDIAALLGEIDDPVAALVA